jgi:hypothetical protein
MRRTEVGISKIDKQMHSKIQMSKCRLLVVVTDQIQLSNRLASQSSNAKSVIDKS